ncbi:hypothetical protein Droror1_Dr00014905 [Drosera rotundifolia]
MISYCLSETKEKPDYCNQVIELLKEMASFKRLSLTQRTLRCIWDADNQILPIFHQLTCLQLNVKDDLIWTLLSRFLESSPKLESLVVVCEGYTCFDKNTEGLNLPALLIVYYSISAKSRSRTLTSRTSKLKF